MRVTKIYIVLIFLALFSNIFASEKINDIEYSNVIRQIKSIADTDWKSKYPNHYSSSTLYLLKPIIKQNFDRFIRQDFNDYKEYKEAYDHYIGRIKDELQKRSNLSNIDEIKQLKKLLAFDFYTGKNIEKVRIVCDYRETDKLNICQNLISRIKSDSHIKINNLDNVSQLTQKIKIIKNDIFTFKKDQCKSLALEKRVKCIENNIEKIKSYYNKNIALFEQLKWLDKNYHSILKQMEISLASEKKIILKKEKELELEKQAKIEQEQNNSNFVFIIASIVVVFFIYIYFKVQNWKKNRPICSKCNSANFHLYKGDLINVKFDHERKNGSIDRRFDNNWKHEKYQGILKCLDCGTQYEIGNYIIYKSKYNKGELTNDTDVNFGKYQAYFKYDGTKKENPFQ